MTILIVSVLILIGVLLVILEIFLIPGITFAIIGGVIFWIGGIVYAYTNLGATGGHISIAVSVVLFLIIFFWLLKSRAINKIALNTDIESTVADERVKTTIKEGDAGVTVSRLNPIGKVKVNGMVVEAKTLGDFLDEDTKVSVLKVYPTQIVVKEVDK